MNTRPRHPFPVAEFHRHHFCKPNEAICTGLSWITLSGVLRQVKAVRSDQAKTTSQYHAPDNTAAFWAVEMHDNFDPVATPQLAHCFRNFCTGALGFCFSRLCRSRCWVIERPRYL